MIIKYFTKGLIVDPTRVKASPMSEIEIAKRKQKVTIRKVIKKLILLLIPGFFQKSSSTVSLHGNTHKGAATNIVIN